MKIFKHKKTGKLYTVGVSKAPYLGPRYIAEPYMHNDKVLIIMIKDILDKDFEVVGVRK
jgi:hypothetical protein